MAKKELINGYVKVDDQASESLKKASKNVEKLGEKAKKAGKDAQDGAKGFGEFAGKLTAIAAPILATVAISERLKTAFDFTKEISNMSSRLGVGVESLSAFSLIAQKNGVSAEELGDSLKDLSKNIGDSVKNEDVKKFEEIGINLKKSNGEIKTTEEVFLELSEVFKNSKDDSIEVSKAMELMGESGLKLLPILNKGSDALKNQKEQLIELGLVLKQETSESINKLGSDFEETSQISNIFFSDLLAVAQPATSELIEMFNDVFKTKILNKDEIKEWQVIFEGVVVGILKASDVIVDAVKIISNSFGLVITVIKNVITVAYELTSAFVNLQTLDFSNLAKNLRNVASLGKETRERITNDFSNIENFKSSNMSENFTKRRENDRKQEDIIKKNVNNNYVDPIVARELAKKQSLENPIKNAKIGGSSSSKNNEADKLKKQQEQELKDFIKINEERIAEEKRINQYSLNETKALVDLKQKTEKDYLQEKELILKKEYDFTMSNYQKIREELEKNINSGKNEVLAKQELQKINEKIINTEKENTINSLKLQYEKIKSVEDYKNSLIDIEKQINSLTNNENKNFEIEIDLKFKTLEEEFKGDNEAIDKIKKLKELELSNNKYSNSLKNIEEINSNLAVQEAKINFDRENGIISSVEANNRLAEQRKILIEQELQTIYSIDKTNLSQQQKNDLILKEIELKTQLSKSNELANQTQDIMTDSFKGFFDDLIVNSESGKDAFKNMIDSMATNLRNLIAQNWSNQLYTAILGDGNMFKDFGSFLFGGSKSGGNSGGGGSSGESLVSIIAGMMGGNSSGGGDSINWGSIISGIAGFFDTGGSMQKNRPYLVGEFGKELFVPTGSGTLYSNGQTSNILNNNSTNNKNNNVTIVQNIKTQDATSFRNSSKQIALKQQSAIGQASKLL